jgi:NB-ARC domain-containing protein
LPVESFITRYDRTGQNLVRRLKNELAPNKAQLVVLHGKGGVGKTALAAETVSGLIKHFRHIVWASAEGRDAFSLGTFLTEIATQLKLSDWRQLLPDQLEQTVRNAVAQDPTLLVLDNFETVAEVEQQRCAVWLNQCRCPELITSRWPVDSAHNEPIDAMREGEAHQFVTKRLWKMSDKRRFASLDRTYCSK